MRAAHVLDKIKGKHDFLLGVKIIKRSIEEPIRQIANNAGEEGTVVVEKVKTLKGDHGYDANNGTYVDMIKAGIIDPAKVARTALQNASSISGLLLTTEAMITDLPEEKEAHDHGPAGGGGMGGMGGGMGGMPGMM